MPPIGEERYQKFFNVNSAFEVGLSVGFGSDYPSMLIPEPNGFHQLQSWMTRSNPEDPTSGTLNADQAISLEQAIKGFTLNAAKSLGFGWDKKLGSIEAGRLADFIVLDQNLFDLEKADRVDRIYKTKVLKTVLQGKVVYDALAKADDTKQAAKEESDVNSNSDTTSKKDPGADADNKRQASGESEYEKRYADQMGTKAPDVANLTQAVTTADSGAVYANRHSSEFAISSWNWQPSSTPLRFKETIKPLSAEVMEHLRATNTDGYIVIKDGVIIHEFYGKGMHPTTKHSLYSAGKSWASAAWHDVLLKVMDKKIGDLVPELKDTFYGPQTVRNLVDMRLPAKWRVEYDDPDSEIVAAFAAMGSDFKSIDLDLFTFLKTVQRNPKFEVGDWNYVDSNAMLLSALGRKLMGVHAYEGERRFRESLGLEHISGCMANLHGQYSSDGGQYFTLRDFVKLPHAVAHDGKVAGRQVLKAYLDDLFTADDGKRLAWKKGPLPKVYKDVVHYSNMWYVVDDNIAMGVGSYGQFMVCNRKNKVAIAKFSTYPKNFDADLCKKDGDWLIEQVRDK